jgi:hypothetical protein
MFSTAARRVEELQQQRHATLTQVLATGVGAYTRLLASCGAGVTGVAEVLEGAHLEQGGAAGGAEAAAEGAEEVRWGASMWEEEQALLQRRAALLTSRHVLRHGRLVLEGKARDWREHEVVLTRGGVLLWASPGVAPSHGVTLARCVPTCLSHCDSHRLSHCALPYRLSHCVCLSLCRYRLAEEGPLSFTLVETDTADGGGGGGPGAGAKKLLGKAVEAARNKMGRGKGRHVFRSLTEEECTEWILRLREAVA